MKTPATPKSINLLRDSYQNGAVTNYNFTVVPMNFMSDGDLITITLPEPIKMSPDTYVIGHSDNLLANQTFELSSDLSTIQIQLGLNPTVGRRLAKTNEAFVVAITNVKNPISLKPTVGSVVYSVYTGGSLIEQKTAGMQIKNT